MCLRKFFSEKPVAGLSMFFPAIIAVWMAPVLLAGYPYFFTPSVKLAKEFAETGVSQNSINPLFMLLLRCLQHVISWQNDLAWSAVSAVTLAMASVVLWFCIRRLFDSATAWSSVIIFCLMPMHWREAIGTAYYPLALLCLFTGFALYLLLQEQNRIAAMASVGFFFGLTLATTHAFFPLLPWFICIYAWERRKNWKKGFAELATCGAVMYMAFALPLLPNALRPGMTFTERVHTLVPIEENLMPAAELYGDEYSYLFLKDEFDGRMIDVDTKGSFIEKREKEHFRINYGVGSHGVIKIFMNGIWRFANAVAGLFMQEVMGGMFLWLFLIPGLIVLYATRRKMLLQLLGLWLSMEVILRFGFRYGRIHLMDIGWVFALIAGVGATHIAVVLHKSHKRFSANAILALTVCIVSLQLIQANRMQLAKEYSRSGVPVAKAVAGAIEALPDSAVIVQPPDQQLMAFSDRSSVEVHTDTLDVLSEQGRLAEVFAYYGATHIVGYSPAYVQKIVAAAPNVQRLSPDSATAVQLTPFKKYVLNLIR